MASHILLAPLRSYDHFLKSSRLVSCRRPRFFRYYGAAMRCAASRYDYDSLVIDIVVSQPCIGQCFIERFLQCEIAACPLGSDTTHVLGNENHLEVAVVLECAQRGAQFLGGNLRRL